MDENDKHIFDQVKSSRVTRVFVSIYGDEYSEANTRTKANAKAKAFIEKLNDVAFYQAESTSAWA